METQFVTHSSQKEGHVMRTGPCKNALGFVRQSERGENMGKSFYCGFYKKGGAGKEAGETGLGFVSVHNFIRLWGLWAVVWDLALG